MTYMESVLRVLTTGLILGAGLPAIFAVGVWSYAAGGGAPDGHGMERRPNPILKAVGLVLFAFVAVVVVIAILWITRNTIQHHFGVNLFPFVHKK